MVNVYEEVDANKRKSWIIIIGFGIFVALVVYILSQAFAYYFGYEASGLGITGMALIISGIMSFASYWWSDKIVLTLSHARPADRKKDFLFYTVAENLAIGAGVPKPKLYVIDDPAPNAFATGRDPDHAVVVTTTGLLQKLNRTELEGVVAHEMSHVRNYDTRLMSVVAVMVGMIALIGDWFLRASFWGRGRRRDSEGEGNIGAIFLVLGFIFAILSPIIAQLIQLAVSRRREFLADAGSVELTRQPEGLIHALEIISKDPNPLKEATKATAHMYIENPFKEKDHGAVGWFANLFNTHPPVSERIKALKAMI
ncbi:MAG TPA: M48 family metallopeptidase [Patescibacteria group bacterium]